MEVCPEGYVCDATATDYETSGTTGTAGYPQACPDGKWCGKGVYSLTHISGDLRTPQECNDGVV
jgi:hypothetical protein